MRNTILGKSDPFLAKHKRHRSFLGSKPYWCFYLGAAYIFLNTYALIFRPKLDF